MVKKNDVVVQLLTCSPLNHRHNDSVYINSYADIPAAIMKQIANLSDVEVYNMQFTLMVVDQPSRYVFGVNRGNFVQTESGIRELAEKNKYAKEMICTNPGSYLVVENYPRSLKRLDHANVPVEKQTVLTYGQVRHPIYPVVNLRSAKPMVGNGDPLSAVYKRMKDEAVASK